MNQKSVLLVDDEVDLVDTVCDFLKIFGYQIYSANDGLEAVENYKKNNPCLVIMDVKMPNMNGLEAFKKIKEFDKNSKVILISGFPEFTKELIQAKKEGLLYFQSKPITLQTYKDLITKYD